MTRAALALVLAACGASAPPPAAPTAAPPSVVPHDVATGVGLVAADATHVYWHGPRGFFRRAHRPGAAVETLLETDLFVYYLAVGDDDVFFVDRDGTLRAIPKTGGPPSSLAAFEDAPFGLVADGDGAWVGVGDRLERWSRDPGERRIALPAAGNLLAIEQGEAFVATMGVDGELVRVDLASGRATVLAAAPPGANGVAVTPTTVAVAAEEGVVTVPRAGGPATRVVDGRASAITADAEGWIADLPFGVVEQRDGEPARVLWWSTSRADVAGMLGIAAGAGHVYHTVFGSGDDATTLRADPRRGTAELFRVDGTIIAIAGTAGGAVVAVDTSSTLLSVDARGVRADASGAFELVDGALVPKARPAVDLASLAEDAVGAVADAFASLDGTDYVAVTYGRGLGVYRVGARGALVPIWRYPDEAGDRLQPPLVAAGGALHIHDFVDVHRVTPDGTVTSAFRGGDDFALEHLAGAGGRVVVAGRHNATATDRILVLDGDAPRTVWESAVHADPIPLLAGAADAVYFVSPDARALVRLPLLDR